MIRRKTFIVGAGASAEFGLPTGTQLVEKIEHFCDLKADRFGQSQSGDKIMWGAFDILPHPEGQKWNPSGLAHVASKVRQNMGLAPSIDNFLDSKRGELGWSEVGKLAIARAILEEERKSKLWFDTSNSYNLPNFANLPPNWLRELFRILVAQKSNKEFCDALASCYFITFNYDRVIEHFFHQAIKSYFDLSNEAADEICKENLAVFHVYGDLGDVNCVGAAAFGRNGDRHYLVQAASRILTFTEGAKDQAQLQIAKTYIDKADVVAFVGFGFLPLNLRILAPSNGNHYSKRTVLGTTKGMSPSNLEIAKNIIPREWYGREHYSIDFEEVASSELIWRNSMFLSELDAR